MMPQCAIQQKGGTCEAKYDGVEAINDDLWLLTVNIIDPKKAKYITVTLRRIDH